MKIVFVRHSLLNRGGDKMIVAHANALAARGHCVEILATVVATIFSLDPRVTVRPLSFRAFGKAGTLLALLRRFDADIVIADIIPLAFLLAFRNRNRVVYFAQDYDESYYRLSLQKLLIRCLYWCALSMMRVPVIGVSSPLVELLRTRFAASAALAENGVDTSVFYREIDACLLHEKEGRRAIVLLSRSDRRKGFDVGQEVVRALPDDIEVWTVGELCPGAFGSRIHRDFGYLHEDRLRQVLSSADLFLYPSRHEGFPLMALEAFACGCPLVTTTAVCCADDGVNALVAPVEDLAGLVHKTSFLLNNPDVASRLAAKAFKVAQGTSLVAATSRFVSLVEKHAGH